MNQFFSNKKLIVLLVSVIICMGMIAFSINRSGNVPFVQQVSNDLTAVTGRLIAKPANVIVSIIESVENLKNTYEENQSLKAKIEQMYETEAELANLKQDNLRMQEQLDLQGTLADYNKVNGAVIGRNPDNWVDQLIVDKGSQSGIEMNMSVMSGSGLIGRVIEVNPTSSKIQLITTLDQNNNRVAASIAAEEGFVYGIVNGYEEKTNRLIMRQITADTTIQPGDQVMTSGLGGISPSALLIGTVDEVRLDAHGLSQEAYLTPAASVNDIRYVTFIQRIAESGE